MTLPGGRLARSPYLRQWLVLGVVLLVFCGSLAYFLYLEHRRIAAHEGEMLVIHAQIVEKNLEPQIFSAKRAIDGILADLPSWQKEKDGLKRANRRLGVISDTLTGIRTLLVIDASGTVVACNREEVVGLNVTHRAYFQAPFKNPDPDTLYVSPPFKTVLDNYLISLTRVIVGPNGEFAGVVNASVDPEYFKILLDSVRHAPDTWTYLAHGDGELFLTMPERDARIDKDLGKPGTYFSRHLESGRAASVFTGTERMMALRTIRPAAMSMDKPLVVAVSRDLAAVFAPWREKAYARGGLFGLLAATVTFGLWFYQRRRRVCDRLAALHEAEQKAMRDNELLLRNIIHNLDEGVLLLDGDGVVVFANRAAEALLGSRPQALLGTHCPQLIRPTGESGDECPLCDARKTRAPFYSRAVEFRRGDGTGIPVSIRATPTGGKDNGLVVAFYDISAEKIVEEDLAASERNLHALIDATPGSAILLDLEGQIETINAIGARRLASTPEALVGHDIFALLPAETATRRHALFAGVCASGEPARMVDGRGQQIFETEMLPVTDAKGELRRVAVYAQDVTEKRREASMQSLFHDIGTLLLRREISLETLIWHFCRGAVPIFGFSFAWVGRKQADGRIQVAAGAEQAAGYLARLKELEMRWDAVGDDPVVKVLRQGKMQVAETGPEAGDGWRSLSWENGARHLICVPLTLEGGSYGVLVLGVTETSAPDAAILKSLEEVGGRLSLAMEAAAQQERLSLMETALESTGNAVFITGGDGVILWANPSFGRLTGYEPAEAIGRKPSLLKSGAHDAAFYAAMWETMLAGVIWQGEVVNARRDGSRFTVHQTITPLRDPEGRVSHFVSILEDVSEKLAAQEQIAHLANYDALTDLPNRRLFFDRLGQALALAQRTGRPCALLFLDLDRFKEVNDRRGHEGGDQLLKAVAERLRGLVRESDTIARLGGDEFTVTLAQVDGRDDCANVAEKIVAAVGHPYALAGTLESIGVSVGIALFPGNATDSESLVGAADRAMYAAKAAGRNTFRFFGDEDR